MKQYETPKIEVLKFRSEDIMNVSTETPETTNDLKQSV